MRLAGMDWQAIADRLDYSSRGAACQDVTRALEAHIAEQRTSLEVYRETELMRLDQLTVEVIRVLKGRHYVVTQSGKIVDDPRTGAPILDDGPVLHAVDRLLKIQDRRAKLLGLDAAQRMEVLSLDAIDAAISELNAQLAASGGEAEQLAGTEAPQD
jgi:hypothetical protein